MLTLLVLEELNQATGGSSLSTSKVRVLLHLYAHGEIFQQNLEKVAGVEKSATSTALIALGRGNAKVQGLGLVEQDRDFHDGRQLVVRLTARGKAVMETALAKAAASLS
ncbi:MAG: winged helix-turn-helix transcriptional regulator [Comamonadaceae bacterium]|jgi:DNA-binding MarR family transcriptional regulator|nr:winged helix-turn-helix transcriptional regulator [Comamonadaceae bacterium]